MSPRTLGASPEGGIPEQAGFVGRYAEGVARELRRGSSGLSNTDQTFLRDFAAGKYRHAHAVLGRLIDLAVRAGDDDAAYAIGDLINAEIAARRVAAACVPDAVSAEHHAEYAANNAVSLALIDNTPTAWERAGAFLQRHARRAENLARVCLNRAEVAR